MKKRIKILAACQDAGGCNAIWPVVKAMADRDAEVSLYASLYSCRILKKKQARFRQIPREALGSTFKILEQEKPNLVLLGTSLGYSLEDAFVEAARRQGIKSVAVFDSWVNYSLRFSGSSDGNLKYLPDYICVSDDFVKEQMQQEGIPGEKIVITGNPYFDDLFEEVSLYTPQVRQEFLNNQGLPPDATLITFFSQAIDKTFGSKINDRNFLGYTQFGALELLIHSLEEYCRKRKVLLVIRPHPKEESSIYAHFKKKSGNLLIVISGKEDARKMLAISDFVAGMFSIALVEAYALGKNVLSIQPGLQVENPFFPSRLGRVRTLATPGEIIGELQGSCRKKKKRKNHLFRINNASKNVVGFICNLTESSAEKDE